MRAWFDAVGRLGLQWGTSFDLDFHRFDQTDTPVPWFGRKRLQLLFG